MAHVFLPKLHRISFKQNWIWGSGNFSPTLAALFDTFRNLDITDDPYIKHLMRQEETEEKVQKLIRSRRTNCIRRIEGLLRQSCDILQELGRWASDFYLYSAMRDFEASIADSDMLEDDLLLEERAYLARFFASIPKPDLSPENAQVSPKMGKLISFLREMDTPEFSGLVFAQQRAVVITMSHLLSIHPETRDRFRCAPFIGYSSYFNRKRKFGDLLNVHEQHNTLTEFRFGHKNLIVATDVLEEGIDISACSLVVCFDKPPNLKSFIQRRGRARRKESNYAIMFSSNDKSLDVKRWEDLESKMIEDYQKEERRLNELRALEMINESVTGDLYVESTGYDFFFFLYFFAL